MDDDTAGDCMVKSELTPPHTQPAPEEEAKIDEERVKVMVDQSDLDFLEHEVLMIQSSMSTFSFNQR
jgi:hypothetical protein